MSTAVTVQRVHIELSRVQTWRPELRPSEDLTLDPRGGDEDGEAVSRLFAAESAKVSGATHRELKKVFEDSELDESAVIRKFLTTAADGKTYDTKHYNLSANSLVHGVLFPQWQIKIPRALTAHLEAFGAGRVDRSGVKFDRLGKTTSGQPIFAVDDATAESIRATFVLDVSLIQSFGRTKKDGDKETQLGLSEKQKEFLVALALWKIRKLLESPYRFRSGCHLRCTTLKSGEQEADINVDIRQAIKDATFRNEETEPPIVTDVFWPREELYRECAPVTNATDSSDSDGNGSQDSDDNGVGAD